MYEFFSADNAYLFTQWIFLRCIALTYFLAFWSLHSQVLGLYGSKGILPIREFISAVWLSQLFRPYVHYPTLFLWKSSDAVLKWAAIVGMIGSLLAFIGYYPAPIFLFLWILYLSYQIAGSEFLSFQWDTLLLEVGFLTIFFSIQSPPPFSMILLFWFFLFRFMFASGMVKFLSRCPAWKSFTAMTYHYETQPLPNRIAYYMHQLPRWFAFLSQGAVLFVELVIPFFIFVPLPFRFVSFAFLLALQVLIFLTGNYAFFNILSTALCFTLLDNSYWEWVPSLLRTGVALSPNIGLEAFLNVFAFLMFVLNGLELASQVLGVEPFYKYLRYLTPFRILNPYGLFARMTLERNEIIVQGSRDGEKWETYEFKWKPGDLKKAPRQVAPHQPRLDWQMWFAALGPFRGERWFPSFLTRLLQGSPEVLALLEVNPFPDQPPQYVRALFYQYHFTNLKTKSRTGEWWERKYIGYYAPPMKLRS